MTRFANRSNRFLSETWNDAGAASPMLEYRRTKKCTGVAGRAFPDGQVSGRNPVISIVTNLPTALVLKQAYPFSLKSQISLAQQPPGGAWAVENFRYNLQT